MILTVGDIRKALAKYSDNDIVTCNMGDSESGAWSMPYPIEREGAIKTSIVSPDDLFRKQWMKLDLSGRKVVNFEFDPTSTDEFWAEDGEEHPFWKSMVAKRDEEIRKMRPLSDFCSGQLFW